MEEVCHSVSIGVGCACSVAGTGGGGDPGEGCNSFITGPLSI